MIGKYAISKAGHDKSQLYIITAVKDDYVFLCDGKLKPFECPKKKRLKHIQIVNATVAEPLYSSLVEGKTVRNEELKYAIKEHLK